MSCATVLTQSGGAAQQENSVRSVSIGNTSAGSRGVVSLQQRWLTGIPVFADSGAEYSKNKVAYVSFGKILLTGGSSSQVRQKRFLTRSELRPRWPLSHQTRRAVAGGQSP
jgi:hypothetical protein